MKAKEIVKSIVDKIEAGSDAAESFVLEVSADFARMRDLNKDRKGGDAAMLRCMKEYNQKWNSVIAQINELPAFKENGRTWINQDDFVRLVLEITGAKGRTDTEVQKEVELLLRPVTVSNESVRRARQNEQDARLHEEARKAALYRLVFGI